MNSDLRHVRQWRLAAVDCLDGEGVHLRLKQRG